MARSRKSAQGRARARGSVKRKKTKPDCSTSKAARSDLLGLERWASQANAAASVVRAWLSLGDLGSFPEVVDDADPEPGGFEIGGVDKTDEGGCWVTLRIYVSNLDVDMAEEGEHLDVNRHQRTKENDDA